MLNAEFDCQIATGSLYMPNGIVYDEKSKELIVSESLGHSISFFKRAADGSLTKRNSYVVNSYV